LLYDLELPLVDKMNKIATTMYGAGKVVLSPAAEEKVKRLTDAVSREHFLRETESIYRNALFNSQGFGNLPICMSKVSGSFTGDAKIKGAPKGFTLDVEDVYVSAGAGFVVAMCGEVTKMPGLPTRPAIYDIDLNTETGEIEGLF